MYTSADVDTATQEIVTTAKRFGFRPNALLSRLLVQVDVPDLVSREVLREPDLPLGWNNYDWEQADTDSPSYTQRLGDEWLRAGKTCLLFVPSVLVKGRFNCLINPGHKDFAQIKVKEVRPFQVDEAVSQPSKTAVFICHASEDKLSIVEPLIEVLRATGITYWYDKEQIKWGDSLTGKVNKALSTCQFVLVVLSLSFIRKQWPQREWQSALNKEIALGRPFVLPLIVGDEGAKREVLEATALQNDKMYMIWTGDPQPIASALLDVLTQIP